MFDFRVNTWRKQPSLGNGRQGEDQAQLLPEDGPPSEEGSGTTNVFSAPRLPSHRGKFVGRSAQVRLARRHLDIRTAARSVSGRVVFAAGAEVQVVDRETEAQRQRSSAEAIHDALTKRTRQKRKQKQQKRSVTDG